MILLQTKSDQFRQEISEAKSAGAQVVELRLDYLEDLDLEDPLPALEKLLGSCRTQRISAIVTLRPAWEGYEPPAHFPPFPDIAASRPAAKVQFYCSRLHTELYYAREGGLGGKGEGFLIVNRRVTIGTRKI